VSSALLWNASVWIVPALLAITLHEAAHGFAARACGDPTAEHAGRLSLNPLRHIDPFGTIFLPAVLVLTKAGFLFGYAKPVPIDPRRFGNFRRDLVIVAAAGPAANLVLARVSGFLYHVIDWAPEALQDWLASNVVNSIKFNIILAVFNMLPLPPLDGGRVAVGVLPAPLARPIARLEPIGMLIVIGLFLLVPMLGDTIGVDLDVARWLVGIPADFVLRLVLVATGLRSDE
jgi:Zn-dependent protease